MSKVLTAKVTSEHRIALPSDPMRTLGVRNVDGAFANAVFPSSASSERANREDR